MGAMVKELVSKSEFSRRAGVTAAAITKACGSALSAAMVGKRINAAHPDAASYLRQHNAPAPEIPATGLDPLYEDCVTHCMESGMWSTNSIKTHFPMGATRAARIFNTIKAAGLVPAITAETKAPPRTDIVKPITKAPHKRGHTVRNEKKKAAAATREPVVLDIPDDIESFLNWTLKEIVDQFGTDAAFVDWLKATTAIENITDKRIKNAKATGELVSREAVKTGIIDPIDSAHRKLLTDGAKTMATRAGAMFGSGASVSDVHKFIADQITSFIRPMKARVKRAYKDV